jgi:hypothetical protein
MAGVRRRASLIRGGLRLVFAVALGVLGASSVWAEATTERSASVLIWAKVIYDSATGQDTLIQVSNTANSMVHAHCFYVNAAGVCERRPSDPCRRSEDCGRNGPCLPQWQEVDFDIWLTKQQPTHWSAGFGRFPNLLDPTCDRNIDEYECNGAGLDPGRIPPVDDPFYGELRCIEVDLSGAPISGNHLKGEATLITSDGDASKYNAIGILGEPLTNDGDTTLCLGGGITPQCTSGAEYQACPDELRLDHFAERSDNPLFGPESQVRTELTLVPCAEDLETQTPTRVVVQFEVTNEFEQTFSGSTTVECWGSFLLDAGVPVIFDVRALGARAVQTKIRPSNASSSGVVGVSEEFHSVGESQTRAAFNLFGLGERAQTDLIIIPSGP